jgi:adenine-specific DNA-methyltransferase
LLENLATWEKPQVYGRAKKMDRTQLKSKYCLITASKAFDDLIKNANCKHILVSYNNTGESKDGRSNARITDKNLLRVLQNKSDVLKIDLIIKLFHLLIFSLLLKKYSKSKIVFGKG